MIRPSSVCRGSALLTLMILAWLLVGYGCDYVAHPTVWCGMTLYFICGAWLGAWVSVATITTPIPQTTVTYRIEYV